MDHSIERIEYSNPAFDFFTKDRWSGALTFEFNYRIAGWTTQ